MHRFISRMVFVLMFIVAGLGMSIILPASAQCTPRTDWGIYVVARGDTVYSIARRFGINPTALIQGNCLINPNRVYVGQQMRVPVGTSPNPQPNPWTGSAPEYPYAASQVGSTYQPFENGFMTWRADTGSIWVFINQGGINPVTSIPNYVYSNLPTSVSYPPPPAGKTLPIFGFRKVYDNFPQLRAALGWAIGGEQGYLMAVQPVPGQSYFTISLPDGRTIRINSNRTWHPDSGTPPPPPVYTTAATFQPFQSGFMVWRADNGEIRVYIGTTTGELLVYPVWKYGPLSDKPTGPVPAYPYVQPIMGFAKVWNNLDNIRQRIGWAIAGEQSFTMTINETPGAWSFTIPNGYTVTQISNNQWSVSGGAGAARMPFGQTAEVPANPSPTPPPAATETPTPTPEPGSTMPKLLNFAVAPSSALPGDTVTVTWDATSAGNVGLMVKFQADYRLFLDMTIGPLPAAGLQSIVLPTHFDVVNTVASFELYWVTSAPPENWVPFEGTAQTVQIGCPTPLFWDAIGCAYAPAGQLTAVYQPFERGFMVRAGDAIYSVIFNDANEASIFAEPQRIEMGTPPEGSFAPDAVFVDLWTSTPLYQEKLGWATGPGESYSAQVQTASYHIRDTSQTHGITLPDGRTILLTGSAFGGPAVRWDWVE